MVRATWCATLLFVVFSGAASAAEWSFKDFMVGDWDMERQKDGMQAPCLSPFVLLARLEDVPLTVSVCVCVCVCVCVFLSH